MTKVHHLIVDSAPIINGQLTANLAENFYTISEVLDEIKDERSRESLARSLVNLQVLSPSSDSLAEIVRFAKITGDFPSLSMTDMKVMALTLELTKRFVPNAKLSAEPKDTTSVIPPAPPKTPKGQDDKELGDEEGWITPLNIEEFRKQEQPGSFQSPNDGGLATPSTIPDTLVACASNDFAMQNCMMQMGLCVVGANGCIIQELKTFLLRCHVCYHITKDMNKVFCPACGHDSLRRATCALDADGKLQIFLRRNFQFNNRGTKFSIPNPVAHKKDKLIFTEDQKEYVREHRKLEKSLKKIVLDDDYVFGEPHSQAGQTVHRVKIGHGKKNINAAKGKK